MLHDINNNKKSKSSQLKFIDLTSLVRKMLEKLTPLKYQFSYLVCSMNLWSVLTKKLI